MPWNNQGGGGGGPWGGGGGQGPWGGGSGGGGGGPQPPNLEELLRKGQDKLRGGLPGGKLGGGIGLLIVALVVLGFWGATGVYRVGPDEQGVELLFGKFHVTTQPGLHFRFPNPIQQHLTPKVTRENQVNIGFVDTSATGRTSAKRDVPAESLMLTGDENIVDIDFAVFWRIKDAGDYLFRIRNPDQTVKAIAESAMREVVGRSKIDDVVTENRATVETDAHKIVQETLDDYQSGIEVIRVKMEKADPPEAVIAAFRDVQAARADLERMRNEAQSYANDVIPRARGESEMIRLQAEGYKERVVADAEGASARFVSIYNEYSIAKNVTRQRMYLETMEEVLSGMNKVVIDSEGGQSGVVPYLPLPEIQKRVTGQGGNQ